MLSATMLNDGVINVYGSVLDPSVRLFGTGTVNLDSTLGLLALGRFEYIGIPTTFNDGGNDFVYQVSSFAMSLRSCVRCFARRS